MSLRFAILAVLSHRDRTGYELTRKIDGSVANFWPATHQQIYKELKQLDESGFVKYRKKEQQDKPDKKIYSITRSGRSELISWISVPIDQTPSRDALLIKLFSGHLVPTEVLLLELSMHEKMHRAKLTEYQETEKEHFLNKKIPDNLLYQYLTLRKGILHEQGWLNWYVETVKRLLAK